MPVVPAVVSAMSLVIDALFAVAPGVVPAGVTVYDGFELGSEVSNFLMIGVDDPDSDASAASASSSNDYASTGPSAAYNEAGKVTCAAMAVDPDGNPKTARDTAFAICGALSAAIRANPTLGVACLLWMKYGADTSLTQDQTDDGATALVVFSVYFRAYL